MLPVSGAEQLNTSDANTTRPISSLKYAYSCNFSEYCFSNTLWFVALLQRTLSAERLVNLPGC